MSIFLQRKAASDKQTLRPKNSQKMSEFSTTPEDDESDDVRLNTEVGQKPKRPKRINKNVNVKLEEAFTGTATMVPEQTQFQPPHDFSAGGSKIGGQDT